MGPKYVLLIPLCSSTRMILICMIITDNQGSDTKRGTGITILNIVGQCGPLLGTRVFPGNQAPYYKVGMSVCAGFMFFNALLALLLRTLLSWENRKLDAKYGTLQRQSATEMMGSEERQKWAAIGEENEGPRFRYIL